MPNLTERPLNSVERFVMGIVITIFGAIALAFLIVLAFFLDNALFN